jgi:hypothetical protein
MRFGGQDGTQCSLSTALPIAEREQRERENGKYHHHRLRHVHHLLSLGFDLKPRPHLGTGERAGRHIGDIPFLSESHYPLTFHPTPTQVE